MAGGNEDPTWTLLLILVAVAAICGVIWFFFHAPLLEVLRYLRMVELAPLTLIDQRAAACFSWLRVAPVVEKDTVFTAQMAYASAACFGVENLREMGDKAVNFYGLSISSIGQLGRLGGLYYRWVLLAVCVYFVYYALFVSNASKFRTRHNLESFIKAQAQMWPVIRPFINFNPAKFSSRVLGTPVPSKLPLFAESLAPEEWLAFHKIPVVDGIPDKERTRRALLHQLGPRWEGKFESLPAHIACLMAAFALKGVQKRDESDEFLGRIAVCWSAEKGFAPTPDVLAEARKYLKDPAIGGEAAKLAAKHAYRTTALLGVLKWGRYMGGVLASAQFLWLRGVDRELWYACNNLGRRTFHSEGAGALAHFMAEDAAGKALPIPRLETALIAMNQYLAANQPTIPPHADDAAASRG